MSAEILYQEIRSEDCDRIISVHRAAFSSAQVARTIYGSAQVGRYLANLIAFPQFQKEHVFWGAWEGKTLVGYAHFTALPWTWHLNNIAVLPAYQGCQIGQRLWTYFVELAGQQGYRQISLDVEHDNQRALSWYQRRGLEIVKTTWTYEKSMTAALVPERELETVGLLDWEQAGACQLAYEFSQFRLFYQESVWPIGRLGKYYFRTRKLLPAVLEGVLAQLDPMRHLLILSSEPLAGMKLEEVGISYRMQAAL